MTAPSPPAPWRDPAARPFLRIDGVGKRFGPVTALDAVSIDIFRGEFFALLGPSGCGKTTLLRMLAGFEQPDRGTVSIDGRDMTQVPPYDRPVNMMFQSYALFPHMTVEDNVAFGLRQEGVKAPDRHRRVEAMLELVKMASLARRRPDQLSGGQRQRVALARALVKEPKVLLLDEPLAALDRKLREETQFELATIQRRVGITFVVVTHDQEEAMTMASRMAVMEAGRVRQIGTPAQIYDEPASRFVADFIGAANLFEGRLIGTREGRAEVMCPDLSTRLVVDLAETPPPGATIHLALRPERIGLLAGEGPPDGTARVAGTIGEIGYFGDSSMLHVALGSGRVLRVAAPHRPGMPEPQAQRGSRVELTIAPGAAVAVAP